MGASVSTNSVGLINKAVTDVIQQNNLSFQVDNNEIVNINISDTQGDVNITNVKVNQEAQVNASVVFKDLNKQNVSDKINQQIEQAVKSLISGLNVAQVSTSVSTLNNIIENCIKIKNTAVSKCSQNTTQRVNIIVKDTSGTVNLNNIGINQLSNVLFNCLSNAASELDLKKATDSMIKSLTTSEAQGLDIKYLAIAAVVVVGSFGMTGGMLIGPIILCTGLFMIYYSLTANKISSTNTLIYLKNNLDTYMTLETAVDSDDINSIQEIFGDSIKLYVNKSGQKLPEHDINEGDLDIRLDGKRILMNVNNSTKFPKEIVIDLPFEVNALTKTNESTLVPESVNLNFANFKSTHRIELYVVDKSLKKTTLSDYQFKPTVIVTKKTNKTPFYKDPLYLGGVGAILIGLIITLNKKK